MTPQYPLMISPNFPADSERRATGGLGSEWWWPYVGHCPHAGSHLCSPRSRQKKNPQKRMDNTKENG